MKKKITQAVVIGILLSLAFGLGYWSGQKAGRASAWPGPALDGDDNDAVVDAKAPRQPPRTDPYYRTVNSIPNRIQ